MKKKKIGIFLALTFVVLLAFLVCSCAQPEGDEGAEGTEGTGETAEPKEMITLRLVVPAPVGDELTDKDIEMAERFNARAKDYGYQIDVHGGGSLVNVTEYLDAVRTGAVEIFDAAPPIYAGKDPRLNGLILPFLFETGEAILAAHTELEELYSQEIFEADFNQKILGLLFCGYFDLFNTKKTVKSPADLQGMLIGAPDPGIAAIVELFGASSIMVAWPDFYSSLDKGVIDGILNSPNGTINNKLTDIVKFFTDTLVPPSINVYSINLDVWNAMPAEVQQMLQEEIQNTCISFSEHYIQQHDKDIETLRELGIEVTMLTDAEREQFRTQCIEYTEEQLAGYEGGFGEKLKAIADKANSQAQ
jgi:TRAP-type C4-dicarboxylate transport system substrate-binding protein